MDLNLLYSEHQHALMRATSCTSRTCRSRHLASAGSVARRIHKWQLTKGASAAVGWTHAIDDTDFAERISA